MNGKGDAPRNCWSERFRINYDSINWKKTKESESMSTTPQPSETPRTDAMRLARNAGNISCDDPLPAEFCERLERENAEQAKRIAELEERLHLCNGTCDLALQHRDAAEAERDELRRQLEALRTKRIAYLAEPAIDGRSVRQQMRKELSALAATAPAPEGKP